MGTWCAGVPLDSSAHPPQHLPGRGRGLLGTEEKERASLGHVTAVGAEKELFHSALLGGRVITDSE